MHFLLFLDFPQELLGKRRHMSNLHLTEAFKIIIKNTYIYVVKPNQSKHTAAIPLKSSASLSLGTLASGKRNSNTRIFCGLLINIAWVCTAHVCKQILHTTCMQLRMGSSQGNRKAGKKSIFFRRFIEILLMHCLLVEPKHITTIKTFIHALLRNSELLDLFFAHSHHWKCEPWVWKTHQKGNENVLLS